MTLLLLLLACGSDDPCAGTRDLAASPAGLTLTADEHGVGWGQEQCFQCHTMSTIHQVDCMDGVDVQAIQELVDPTDMGSCVSCHGDNGTELVADTGGAL